MTLSALHRARRLASDALADEPAGILTDFDGTLSPIVADPARSQPVDGAMICLAELAKRLAVVAVITGRAPMDVRRMLGVPDLLIAGNHGTEWLEPGADRPETLADAAAIHAQLEQVLGRLPVEAGVALEHKGASLTVHYRNAPDPDAALGRIETALGALDSSRLEARRGRMSIELRPVGLGDKGTATERVIARFGLRGVVVMGDDITDLDMFGVVARLRAAGAIRGAIIGVGGADEETPDAVRDAADVVLDDPAQVAELLGLLASA